MIEQCKCVIQQQFQEIVGELMNLFLIANSWIVFFKKNEEQRKMDIKQVKENLGKEVLWKSNKYILLGYACRINPLKPNKIFHELELLDNRCNHAVIVVNISDVQIIGEQN